VWTGGPFLPILASAMTKQSVERAAGRPKVVRFAGRADDDLGQCLHNRNKARIILSIPNPPLIEPQRVAFLTGYVLAVDGKDVSAHGRSFRPFCPVANIVVTPSKSGTMDSTEES